MSAESWLKIALPAFPLGFTILGIGLYWRENPIALLPYTLLSFQSSAFRGKANNAENPCW
jgi:hypothetical protein